MSLLTRCPAASPSHTGRGPDFKDRPQQRTFSSAKAPWLHPSHAGGISHAGTILGGRRSSDTTSLSLWVELLERCPHTHSERTRVLQSPRVQLLQRLTEGAAFLGKEVGVRTTAGRPLSRYQARSGQVSQPLTQHLVAQARDESSQLRIAARSLFQIGKNHRLPFSPEHGECELGGAVEVSR